MSIAGNDALSVAARPTSPVTGPSPLLTVDALCKNFGGVRVLEKTTFTLPEGQVTCLVGPNGAGKTTAFDCITGFLSFDAGSIRLRGDDLTGLGRGEIVQRGSTPGGEQDDPSRCRSPKGIPAGMSDHLARVAIIHGRPEDRLVRQGKAAGLDDVHRGVQTSPQPDGSAKVLRNVRLKKGQQHSR